MPAPDRHRPPLVSRLLGGDAHYLGKIGITGLFTGGVIWWLVFRLKTGLTLEDALITYRYAENLSTGNGFVFNLHQPVLGTSTPLLTLFLAALGLVFGAQAIPMISTIAMTCFGVLAGLLVYRILARLDYPVMPRILSIPLFFGSTLVMVTSVGGMETPLVLFLMAASALALLRRQPVACILLSALLLLTRPDGIIWTGLMAIAASIQSRRVPWKGLLAAACVVVPWAVFAIWYFGSLLPHSIVAKQTLVGSGALTSRLSPWAMKAFADWYIGAAGARADTPLTWVWLLALVWGATSYMRSAERRGFGGVIIGYIILHGAFLYFGRAPHFRWYLVPPLLCSLLLIAPGIWELSCAIAGRLPASAGSRRRVGSRIAAGSVGCIVLVQNIGTISHNFKFQQNELQTRREAGLWLQKNTAPESVVAMEAVGYQGYFSRREVIDLVGLVSPRVVEFRRQSSSNAEVFHRVLSELKPDYLVLRSFEVDENRHFHGGPLFETEAQRGYFVRHYGECARFSAPYPETWGELAFLTIYARRGPQLSNSPRRPAPAKPQVTAGAPSHDPGYTL